eukprot:scaffold29163_cov18-Tisochrysis_lutea.AAC.1
MQVVKELVNRGADINSRDWKGSTPLTNASLYGQEATITFYTHASCTQEATITFYTHACCTQEAIVRLLLECGADPNHYTTGGMMAVHRAAQ